MGPGGRVLALVDVQNTNALLLKMSVLLVILYIF
jgi:hypothetical protein